MWTSQQSQANILLIHYDSSTLNRARDGCVGKIDFKTWHSKGWGAPPPSRIVCYWGHMPCAQSAGTLALGESLLMNTSQMSGYLLKSIIDHI